MRVAAISIIAISAFAAIGRAHAGGTKLDPQLRAYLKTQFTKFDTPDSKTRIAVARADLSKDSPPVILVYLVGEPWCGSGGCTLAFVQSSGRSFRVVSRTPIVELPVKVLPSRSHGWNDIAVGTTDGSLAKLVFNGKRYVGNPSVAERVPGSQGAVLIPKSDGGQPLSP